MNRQQSFQRATEVRRRPLATNCRLLPTGYRLLPSDSSAFTLIEMLAVLVIVGVFIVVAMPALNNLSRSAALPGALRQVANEASLARQYAITHRVETEVRVTNSLNAVSIFTNVGPNEAQLDKWNYLPVGTVVYYPPITVLPPPNLVTNVVFTPTGATTNLNPVTFCVREGSYDTNSSAFFGTNLNVGTISINNLLGRILVQRP